VEDRAEDAIRAYLRLLTALPEDDGDAWLHDPIKRLRLRAEAEQRFVDVAQRWAARHGISGRAFLEEGVSAAVLRRAGMRHSGAPTDGSSGRAEEEVSSLMPRHQPFTVEGLMARTDLSRRVVTTAVQRAVERGEVEPVSVSEVQGRPGGSTVLYRRMRSS
jgi:hypothetical protein